MTLPSSTAATVTERGLRIALIFALTAERLTLHYEHGQWLSEAQAASLAADWLARSRRTLPRETRQQLAALSDTLARQITQTLSREAGLFTAHEMQESLDPNYQSDIGRTLMAECEKLLDIAAADAPASPEASARAS